MVKGWWEVMAGETYLQKQDALECVVNQLPNSVVARDTLYIRYLVMKGAEEKYGFITDELLQKINYELKVISDLGFNSYFLIVWDLIKEARAMDIPIGPGRGSVGGSIVAYCLDIIRFDPIEYDLIFERFLNPERPEMPDIDIDICQYRRQEVIANVARKYGHDHIAQIMTYQTLKLRSLVDAVGKAMRIGWNEIDMLRDLLPEDGEEEDTTLADALDEIPEFRKLVEAVCNKVPDFLDVCIRLEGHHRAESKHAGGVIICDVPICDIVPLFAKNKKDAAESDSSHPTVQLDMKDSDAVGLLKIDLLGLRTLSVINQATNWVKEFNPDFDIEDVPLDDEEVYKMLRNGKTKSVFQLEGQGITSVVKRMHLSTFDDIIALLALYRPGPLDAKMDTIYINRKLGKETVTYLLPELIPILGPTWGVILYQEQVMRMAMMLASYTAGESDKLRKAMGKKDKEMMAKEMGKFKSQAIANGHNPQIIEELVRQLETFARYGFNKSHSTAYALNTYRTAYLKCHYPLQYMAAEMNSFLGKNNKLASVISEIRAMGLPMLPPHINHSYLGFHVDGYAIRFGLSGIKGVGPKTVEAIMSERKNGAFDSLYDFCERIAPKLCNVAAKKLLVLSGAFDHFGDRAFMVHELNSRYDKIYFTPDSEIYPMKDDEKLEYEKNLLNFYISGTPFSVSLKHINRFGAVMMFDQSVDFGKGIAGVLKAVRPQQSSRGTMAFMTVETENGEFSCTVFSDSYKRYDNVIKGAINKMVVLRGKYNEYHGKQGMVLDDIAVIDKDSVICNSITIDVGTNPSIMYLAAVRHECSCSSGRTDVIVVVNTGEEEVEVITDCKVQVTTALISSIESIIGVNKISYGW